uniref:Uncharacterized protein n=1 Tax=Cacopsylla melanoneura TaxID=428564 RepID=A0A8D8Y4Z8_9HEMI
MRHTIRNQHMRLGVLTTVGTTLHIVSPEVLTLESMGTGVAHTGVVPSEAVVTIPTDDIIILHQVVKLHIVSGADPIVPGIISIMKSKLILNQNETKILSMRRSREEESEKCARHEWKAKLTLHLIEN